MKRSGYADLPLHGGHVPSWLATHMTILGTAIVEAVLYEYGRSEVLTRLSDPFWFQALGAVLAVAHDAEIHTFADALLLPRMGPRALQSLALVSEVIHGTPSRFSDPARFSFAHGGKDRRPFPVPTKIYDRTIEVLSAALRQAKLGDTERANGFKRLHAFTRMVEDTFDPCADLDKTIAKECADSASHGGRSIFGWEKPPTQLTLWDT